MPDRHVIIDRHGPHDALSFEILHEIGAIAFVRGLRRVHADDLHVT